MGLMEKIFGDINTKEVKKVEKIADQVMALEDQMAALTDEELKAKTPEFKGVSQTAKRWMTFCRRRLRSAVRRRGEVSA